LGAEINLAALACVLREDSNGVQITDPVQLCDCSRFGVSSRNSDPTIGSFVNNLATLRFMLTLHNPVGLYIMSFSTAGWTGPNGQVLTQDQLNQIVVMTRGAPGYGLHYTVRVPDSFGFVLGDMEIAGQPIKYGGQVAYTSITVGLTGSATTAQQPAQEAPLLPCGQSQAPPPTGITHVVEEVEHKVEKALHIAYAPRAHFAHTPLVKPIPKSIPKTRVFY